MHKLAHDRGRQVSAPAAGATRRGTGPAGQRRMPILPAAVAPLLIAVLAGCGASSSPGAPAASGRSGSAGHTATAGGTGPAGSTTPAGGGASSPAGGATPASSGQSGPVTPGHGSPADAVDGYYQALLAGNGTLACSYLLDDVSSCPAKVSATGHFTIVRTAESGALAVVAVTGQICFSGGCMSNSNPDAGMPTGSESVSQAFADATVTGSSSALSPVTCEESSHGGWYIAVNGG